MKKTLIITILSLSAFCFQKASAQNYSWGVMTGVNASMVNKLVDNSKFKPGANAGIFVNYSNEGTTGIKAELLYSQMGSAFKGNNSILQLHYIQLPVYGVWYLNDKGNKLRPKLMAGPYIGALVGVSGSENPGNDYTKSNLKKIDAGVKAAFGLNYKIRSRIWLNSELYFAQGLTNNFNETMGKTMVNQSYGLNVGVSLPIN